MDQRQRGSDDPNGGGMNPQRDQQRSRGVSWQNPEQDKPVRQTMITKIYNLLRLRKPDADEEWLRKLPDMAKRLEDKLYRHAGSMMEYNDDSTLKPRLQQIATEMRTQSQQPAPITVSTHGIQPLPLHPTSSNQVSRPLSSSPPASYTNNTSTPGTPLFTDYPASSSQNSHAHQQQQQAHSQYQHYQGPPPQSTSQQQVPSQQSHSMMGAPPPQSSSQQGYPSQQISAGSHQQQGSVARSPSGSQPSQRDVLRQQQQRLLLLRHASKCPAKPGECRATPHCSQMKTLWKHIATCKDQNCAVPHCVSSRFVLAHYHRCTDQHCDVCEPVRKAISSKNSASVPNANGPSSNGQGPAAGPVPQQQQQAPMNAPPPMSHSYAPNLPHPGQGKNPPPMPGSSVAPPPMSAPHQPQPLQATGDAKLNALIARYIEHWKMITGNAEAAKKKQESFELAKQEEKNKNKEAHEAKEQEKQLAQPENGMRDEVLEAHHRAIRLKYESAKAAARAAQLQCQLLEAEVRAMKLQHEKNLQIEKQLQAEFAIACNKDPEKVKRCIYFARSKATAQQQEANGMGPSAGHGGAPPPPQTGQMAAHPMSMPSPHMRPPSVHGPPPQQMVVPPPPSSMGVPPAPPPPAPAPPAASKSKPKKEPAAKEPKKKAEKGAKKDKNAAAQGTGSTGVPIPGTPMMPIPASPSMSYMQVPPPQMQGQVRPNQPGMAPSMLATGGNVPPPPPSVRSTSNKNQSPTPKASPRALAPPGPGPMMHMPMAQMPPHLAPPRPVFREAPQINRHVLDTSLINIFNRRDIEAHIQSLARYSKELLANKFRDSALSLLKKCQDVDVDKIFEFPVDPVRDCAPGYLDIIKKPMDFQTVRSKLDTNAYSSLAQFAEDVRLIFANCMKYNPSTTIYYDTASMCGRFFEKEYARFLENEEERSLRDRFDSNHCRLCGQTAFTFEQVAYYCAGPCQRRIGRTTPMYSSSDNRHWCNSCFQNELPETIVLNDGTSINKRELRRGRHPEPVEEGWVECYCCKRWFHQVCAMLNTKRGQDDTKKDDFMCPFCVLVYLDHQKTDRVRLSGPEPKRAGARDLPENELSKFLEKAVNQRVQQTRKEYCAKHGQSVKDVEDVNPLTVRVVMAKDAEVWTRQNMMKVYPKFPKAFNSRQKVVLMFEKLDGVDVLLFIMFLQHYGSDCPSPNDRSLYIAYLDSVYYFRPSFIRTAVYHELITSVLEFEKRRGITRCFIWACPPTGGDDYIFHVHPKNQKTPKPDRLRIWYLTLLEDARLRGIIVSVSNLFDEYLSRVSDLVDVPYFEGDCWPTYAEHYIAEMEAKGVDPRARQPRNEAIKGAQTRKGSGASSLNDSISKSAGPKRQKRAKSIGGGKSMKARSASQISDNGDDEMDVVSEMPAALMCPPPKPLEQVPLQSLITAKIAFENDRMKDDFIVVKMYYDCVECATPMDYPGALYWLPKIYSPDKDPHDYRKRRYAPPYCLCHECYLAAYNNEFGVKPEYTEPAFPPSEWADEYQVWQTARQNRSNTNNGTNSQSSGDANSPPASVQVKEEADPLGAKKLSPASSPAPGETATSSTTKRKSTGPGRKRKATGVDVTDLETADSSIEVLEPGKTARPPNPYPPNPIPLTEMEIHVAMIRPKTVDPDPLIESQIFNLREDFLSLCQGNKYQFDELRRAKHSSMMILYHLHNPESDAFVHTCNGCKSDITTARYTCLQCQDFDLCQNCNGKVKHAHPLEKVTSSTSSTGDMEGGDGGGANANAQNRSSHMQYLQMLEHCAGCENPNCQVPNCSRMKKILEHAPSCPTRISGGCPTCKRYWQLLAFHARQCRQPSGTCKVPHCERIKGHIRAQTHKTADRRMMAIMQRSNQAAAPPEDQAANSSYAAEGQQNTPSAVPVNGGPPGAPAGPGMRSLTSPRGKGGKGPRAAN